MKNKITILTLVALILGIICGLFFKKFMNDISFIGTSYINCLKFMIVPVIFTSISTTVFKSQNSKNKTLIKTILLFIIMFIITFIITFIIAKIIGIGTKNKLLLQGWEGTPAKVSFISIIKNLFPSNLGSLFMSNNILATIIFSAIFGYAAFKVDKKEKIIKFLDNLKNIIYKIIELIMYFTPVAVFSLIGLTVANYGGLILSLGFKYILIAYICSIVIFFLVMILPVILISKISILEYLKRTKTVYIMTLSTCSSAVTLPTTIKTCNKEFGISDKITNIVVPLGCTINMCGGAVSFAILGIFTSKVFGINIDLVMFLQMLLISLVINMAAPGIPGGGIVLGATYLSALNLPLSFMGFYSSIYRLLDMAYTSLNVGGDITANVIIGHTKKS